MPELEESGVRLVAETSQYDSAMRQVIADADKVDAALDDVVDAADRVDRQLKSIDGNIDAKIKTSISDDSAITRIEGLADQQINLDLDETGLTAIETDLAGIADEPVSVLVSETGISTVTTELAGIADEPVTVDVTESGLTAVENRISGIADETVGIKTELKDASGIKDTEHQLDLLQKLATINIALALSSGAGEVIDQLQNLPGVGALNDIEQATRVLQATSGGTVDPQLLELAKSLNENAFAPSITDAAIFLNQLKAMGIEGDDELTRVAFGAYQVKDAFSAMGQDVDLLTVATAQQALVANNLVGSYQEASDLLSAGATEGLNIGDDMIDSVIEYADSFETLGLTGSEVFDTWKAGISAGFKNTDFISDMLREFNTQLGEAAGDPQSAQAQALRALGLDNPVALGEKIGADTIQATFDAIANAPAADRPTLLSTLFGSQAEDNAGAAATLGTIEPIFAGIEGRAQETSDFLNNTLGTILTGFFNTINIRIAELLSSDKIDIPGKIEAIKNAISTFIGELGEGGSFASALSISLGINETDIQRVESIFGNFVLALLDVASVIAGLAGQTEAMNAIRRVSFDQAQTQFVFDAKLADNGQALEDQIALASFRGFTAQDVRAGLGQAIDELISEGELERARDLAQALNDIQGLGGNVVNGIAIDEAIPYAERTEALNEYEATVQRVVDSINNADFDTFFAEIGKIDDPSLLRAGFDRASGLVFPGVAQDIVDLIGASDPDTAAALQPLVDDMKVGLTDRMIEAVDNGDFEFARQIAEKGLGDEALLTAIDDLEAGNSEKWDAIVADAQSAGEDVNSAMATAADDLTPHADSIVGDLDRIDRKLAAITAEAYAANSAITAVTGDGSSDGSGIQNNVTGGDLLRTGTNIVGPGEIVTMDSPGAGSVINSARSQELMQALGAIARIPANGGGVVNNYINVSQANHVRNMAQANAAGYQLSSAVRGFA